MSMERLRIRKPAGQKPSPRMRFQHTPALSTTAEAVQRARDLSTGRLRVEDVMTLQQTLGNRATAQMLKPSPPPGSGDGALVQRQYTGELIIYSTIESEKDKGEISTGWKLHATLTKRVANFHNALRSGNLTKIVAALNSIMERLNKDSRKKLKAPKTISKSQQTDLAAEFFARWKSITQEHLNFLSENGAKGVADLQTAYNYPVTKGKSEIKLIDEEESEVSSSTSEIFGSTVDFNNPPWSQVINGDVKGSGKGGAIIVTFKGGGKIVVKRNSPGEVLGARMAQASGLAMPQTRLAGRGESDAIGEALTGVGITEQNKWASPYTIIEFVSGVSVTEFLPNQKKIDPKQINALAASMGRWFAFNLLTGDNDNFNRLAGMPGGVNTGNYMVSGRSPNQVTAIDQTVMGGTLENWHKAVETIVKSGDFDMFALSIADDIVKALGSPKGVDGESLMDIITEAAKDQLLKTTETLDRSTILEMNRDLGVNNINDVISRVETIAQSF